jgi:hypothetical protein
MGLDNVAVKWPRSGRFYDPVAPAEFVDFAGIGDRVPDAPRPAVALADHISETGTAPVSAFADLIDLLLGLDGVLYATDAAAEDEDPVIDPDGCAWIAGGLERFVTNHAEFGEEVTFESVADVMRTAIAGGRLAEQQIRWLDGRLAALKDDNSSAPAWNFSRVELIVLARFYRRCADRGFAVYADF